MSTGAETGVKSFVQKPVSAAKKPRPATNLNSEANPVEESFEQVKVRLTASDSDEEREKSIADFVAAVPLTEIGLWLNYLATVDPSELAADLKHRLTRRWSERDPQAVVDWLNITGTGQDLIDDLAVVWVNQNPSNALDWGRSLNDEDLRNRVLTEQAGELVRSDPTQALTIAIDLPADSSRGELVTRATAEWAVADPENAAAWAEKVFDENLRSQILASVAVAWAKRDPAAAANLAVSALPAGRLQENTVVSVVQRWAQIAPQAAAQWVEQFPAGILRQAAIENLCEQWAQTDALAASTWRQSL